LGPRSGPYIKDAGLDALVGGDGEPRNVVLPRRERLDRTLPAVLRTRLSKETVRGEIVDRDRDHEPGVVWTRGLRPAGPPDTLARGAPVPHSARVAPSLSLVRRLRRMVLFTLPDVVRQDRFLDVAARGEQPAGRVERLGDFGDDSQRAENRELRPQRGEQVTAGTLP